MALREGSAYLGRNIRSCATRPMTLLGPRIPARASSSRSALDDLEPESSLALPQPTQKSIDKFSATRAERKRRRGNPPRHHVFSPRYYRGPLHPHQPPPPSDPTSREFVPGPFSVPRLKQTYQSTFAPDLLTLSYTHFPPGERPGPVGQRLRSWDSDSPYVKNRPFRKLRGDNPHLPLVRKPITFRNVPTLRRVMLHCFPETEHGALSLHVAFMVLQAIGGVKPIPHRARTNVGEWNLSKNKHVSLTSEIAGEGMWDFVGKLVELVLPRLRDWKGMSRGSGDSTGNMGFGLDTAGLRLFPEVEVNYEMYPPHLFPGCHINFHTTAATDKDARLLLSTLGIPMYGEKVD